MKYKILLVDDEPANLRALLRTFRQDYELFTAESGPEALTLLQQHEFAVLISDQRMPQMTGIELMKQAVELRPQMVKILLTGYTDIEALIESINCGLVYYYLTKPWNNDALRLTVNRATEHYEAIKSMHLAEMENKRYRSRLAEIHELTNPGSESFSVGPRDNGGDNFYVSRPQGPSNGLNDQVVSAELGV